MPSSQIRIRWFQAFAPGNPWWENTDGSLLAHTEGCEENLSVETQIQNLRMSDPVIGLWMRQLLPIVCVALSLALVALGGSDPTGRFQLRTLSFGRPHSNHGTHFGYGYRIL
jgi:hypothetical protein